MSRLTEMTLEEELFLKEYRGVWLKFKKEYASENLEYTDAVTKMTDMEGDIDVKVQAELNK